MDYEKSRFDKVFDALGRIYLDGRISLDDYDEVFNLIIDAERGARDHLPYNGMDL